MMNKLTRLDNPTHKRSQHYTNLKHKHKIPYQHSLSVVASSSPRQEVGDLNRGLSYQEELSSETTSYVADLVDIDRTGELLTWIFESIWKPKQAREASAAAIAGQSAALVQSAVSSSSSAASGTGLTEVATLGGGCFWCLEACFRRLQGVTRVTSGYAGGSEVNPTYAQVSEGATGHAEVVQVEFDPSILTYEDILQIFFSMHDASTKNRQGNDVGPQYRSFIMLHNDQQREVADRMLARAAAEWWYPNPPTTELCGPVPFYPAEEEHQDFFSQHPYNGYCRSVVLPKLSALRSKYSKWWVSDDGEADS